jgi:hypothetical protein
VSLADAKRMDSKVRALVTGIERSWVQIAQLCERCKKGTCSRCSASKISPRGQRAFAKRLGLQLSPRAYRSGTCRLNLAPGCSGCID